MTTQHAKSNAREGDGVAGLPAKWREDAELANQHETDVGYGFSQCADELEAALQAQQGAEPVAWQSAPTKAGHYWHFDGDVTRMEFVFPRPGHSYLAVQEDHPNGKRHFRMAEKIGGHWYGPVICPPRPATGAPR